MTKKDYEKLVGATFGGRYKTVSVIGVGGMSVVYGAYDLQSGKTLALKLLDDSTCETEKAKAEARRRFKNEAATMSSLCHPNIVNICDSSTDTEPMYFVMEYVEANTLKTLIDRVGALSFEETIFFTKQILNALIHTHGNGIIHCDIKPQNIMLLPNGSIKLTDFGIARFIDSDENRESDTAVGTVYYISPEQASGKRIDGCSDLYSLGVMMYEMATGRLPFTAEDTAIVSRMHIEQSPMRPRVLDPEIPTGLEQIILHAMEKTSFMRFENAEEMLEAVEMLERDPDIEFDFNGDIERANEEKKAEANNVKGWVFALAGAAISFIIVLIITIIAVTTINRSSGKTELTVPALEGSIWYGTNLNEELYDVKVKYRVRSKLPENTVISQSIRAGKQKYASEEDPIKIKLTVSRKNNILNMGDYSMMHKDTAKKKLENLGYRVKIEYVSAYDVPRDHVVSTSPKSSETARIGQTVTLYVCNGK